MIHNIFTITAITSFAITPIIILISYAFIFALIIICLIRVVHCGTVINVIRYTIIIVILITRIAKTITIGVKGALSGKEKPSRKLPR